MTRDCGRSCQLLDMVLLTSLRQVLTQTAARELKGGVCGNQKMLDMFGISDMC